MRDIDITAECQEFIESLNERADEKFDYVLQIMLEVKVVSKEFVKKIESSTFYEMRVRAGNEYRIILFAIDHLNFIEAKKVVLLNGFVKKANKDYKKALKKAERLLEEYTNEK